MHNLIQILVARDGITEQEARELILKTREELLNSPCSDGADIIMENLGLEPDYIIDILSGN